MKQVWIPRYEMFRSRDGVDLATKLNKFTEKVARQLNGATPYIVGTFQDDKGMNVLLTWNESIELDESGQASE